MLIQDMFYKKIERDIKGVIKVGQADEENVYQELEEYVVTSELSRYMSRFFKAYKKGVDGNTDKMGVWISGFFGSGKSHFLKILSYILSDKMVTDENGRKIDAASFFLDGVKVEDKSLAGQIKDTAELSGNTDVILFNIDSKSTSDSKMNKEAIKDVFMKVFNDYLGYCGSIPFLAEFERKIDLDGRYDDFKKKFEEINGTPWTEAREDYYFIQDEIIEVVVSLGIMSGSEAKNWAENAQNTYSLSINKLADYVKKYCESKGKNHHVLFLVDEIGQYIADDSQLMVNLQTVTEDLGTACRGKAWVVVTSQQDIDSITKTMGDDFSKIQGRFDTRIALSSANVDEVIRKRILYKDKRAEALLKKLYQESIDTLKHIISFSQGTPEMPLYQNEDDFVEVYPFIPYQFKLLGNVLTSIRQYSSSGKHLADGERSMLALFKEAAVAYKDENEGILIPFNAFYGALDDFIDHTHRIVISGAARNSRFDSFDVELLKVLFMIKHVNNFDGNVENLTTLMISSISEDTLELKKRIEGSLRKLCDEMLVQEDGGTYIFLTNEEQEAENAIRKIHVEGSEVVNYVAKIVFDEILSFPNSRFKYDNRHMFLFNQQIDDRMYHNVNINDPIGLHILTAYSGKEDEYTLGTMSMTEKNVIARLSDKYPYLSEIEEMMRIESFLNKPDFANLIDFDTIAAAKRRVRTEKARRVKDYIRYSLDMADLYVHGSKVNTKAKEAGTRISDAFRKLIESQYSKLNDMKTEPSSSDIMGLLKKSTAQMKLDIKEENPNQYALTELIDKIRYASVHGAKYSIKQALDNFMAAPYGYTEEDIEYLVADLYKSGQISLKMNSVVYSPASTPAEDAFKYITKREYREKVLLDIKAVPNTKWVKSVKDITRDFYGKTVISDDTDTLMEDFKMNGSYKRQELLAILASDYSPGSELPGRRVIDTSVRLIDDTCGINDPMTFYKRVDELFDDFDETSIDLSDLMSFLNGSQKKIYEKACMIYRVFDKSRNFIADQEIIGYAENIRKIKKTEKPYGQIPKMDEAAKNLEEAMFRLLEQAAEEVKPSVYDDFRIAKEVLIKCCSDGGEDEHILQEAVIEDRPYAGRLLNEITSKFNALIDKVDHANDIAALRGIPSESTAMLDILIDKINAEETLYQQSMQSVKPTEPGEPENPVKPVPAVPKTVTVSVRSLTNNKTFTIRDEADIDVFVEEMRTNLKKRLGDHVVIKLS